MHVGNPESEIEKVAHAAIGGMFGENRARRRPHSPELRLRRGGTCERPFSGIWRLRHAAIAGVFRRARPAAKYEGRRCGMFARAIKFPIDAPPAAKVTHYLPTIGLVFNPRAQCPQL